METGLQVGEELIKRKTFKIQRAPQVWGMMMNSIDCLLSLGGPGKNRKDPWLVTHTSHLLPVAVSFLWVDFQTDKWTHVPRTNLPILSVLETSLLTWPWVRALSSIGKIPCRRKWQLNPIYIYIYIFFFFSGKSHGQRSLVGYSPGGPKSFRQDLAAK